MCVISSRFQVLIFFLGILFSPPTNVDAAEAPIKGGESYVQELKEYVVSDSRLPTTKKNIQAVPAKITVITDEDIERIGAKTVQEAIQYSTGIVMYNAIGNNFEQTIDLRGFNAQPVPSTSVFVDGVRINNPDFNTINFDLIPLETIKRIEIYPGSSAIFGKNALGGVINILTKDGTKQHRLSSEAMAGSYQRQRLNLNASGPIKKVFNYYTSLTRELEKGFRQNSGARISRIFGKFGFTPTPDTKMNVSYTYVHSQLDQAGSLPLPIAEIEPQRNFTDGDYTDRENNNVRVNFQQALPFEFSVAGNTYYRRLQQETRTVGQTSQINGLFDVETWGGALQGSHRYELGAHRNELVGGSEYTRNDFGADDLAFFFSAPGSPTITKTSINEDILAFYLQDTLTLWSRVILTGGVRYDHDQYGFEDNITPANNLSRRFSRTTPRAGVTVFVFPETSVYFNYSEGFRVPTVDELFTSRGAFGSSDPDLKPVKSESYEVGLKTRLGQWGEGTLTFFHIDVTDDIITSCADPSCSPVASNQNVDKTRRRGIETTVKGRLNKFLDGVLNYTFTEAHFRSNVILNPFFLGGSAFIINVPVGSTIPLVPKHRLSLTGNYHPIPGLTLSLTSLYVSPQFLQNDSANARNRLPSYFLLNGRASYERNVFGGVLKGFLLLNNMTDTNYYTQGIYFPDVVTGGGALEAFVVPGQPISVYGGLSFVFDVNPT